MQIVESHIHTYLSYCQWQKGLSAKTIKAYRIDLSDLQSFLHHQNRELDREAVQTYIATLQKKYKPKTVKRKIASIRAFCSFLEYEEILLPNPFSHLRIRLHIPMALPRTIPLPIIGQILHTAYHQKSRVDMTEFQHKEIIRDVAVLELLFATGMRVSEICSLKKDSVDFIRGEIRILGKGAKERIIQLENPEVQNAVKEYMNTFKKEILLTSCFFVNRRLHQLSEQSVREMINRYTKLAGIERHITPHMFRHSFATLLLEEDVDIRYIQRLLGHSSIATTQIYTHVSSKKQRDILIQKHPRNKINLQ